MLHASTGGAHSQLSRWLTNRKVSFKRRLIMQQQLALTSILVGNYDEAIDFYVNTLGFNLVEDTTLVAAMESEPAKRWVVVRPKGATESGLLLAQAADAQQRASIGNQCGGRVFLFLRTDDFWRDYNAYKAQGVEFIDGEPREEAYGTVTVFVDSSGNKWDLIEPRSNART